MMTMMIIEEFMATERILREWAASILGVELILRRWAESILGKWPEEALEAEPV